MSLTLLWGQAYAQEIDTYEADPPERAARLSYISGDVSLQPEGEDQWVPALLNRPLTTGDKLWTEPGARVEVEVGPAEVRLDSSTGFSFFNVGNDVVQMRITAGVMNVSVRSLADNEQIEIDTPNVAVSLLRPGSYRIEVNDAGDATVVKVSDGAAEVNGPSQNVVVHAEQVVTFSGVENLVARFDTLRSRDEFDDWALDRDRRDDRAASSRTAEYVSPDVTGYQDLDDNGSWSAEPDYGYVWTPTRVAVGWSPYRYGRWVSVAPWGWTWIDDAPWGYAPFHYGRWAHVRNRWCWVPGPRHVRAVYAPALVGWVGSPGLNVSWFPLGPREIYVPGRRHSRHYFDRVNASNTYVVNHALARAFENRNANYHYRNRAAPGGVTTVAQSTFTSAGRIGTHRARIDDAGSAQAPASGLAPRIAPGRESRLGGVARTNMRVPPRSIVERAVVARREPPRSAANSNLTRPWTQNPDRARERVDRGGSGERRDRTNDVREREDRPWRTGRPVESTPQIVSPVSNPHGIAARVREDAERQSRESQQRGENEQRQRETQREDMNRRWQRQDNPSRSQREQSQDVREQQIRERVQRQPEVRREAPPRVEQRERARVERPQQVERPQRVERPQTEQPRSESPGRTEGRSQPDKRRDSDSRPSRR